MTTNLLYKAGTLLMTVALLASCVKDDLTDVPLPGKGAIVVRPDWSGRSAEAPVPNDYVVRLDGREQTASGAEHLAENAVEPGDHDLLVYNRAAGFTVSGDVATVNAVPGGEADLVESLPDYLYSYYRTVGTKADSISFVEAQLVQRVRRLEVVLTVVEGDAAQVRSLTATLSGVDGGVHLLTGALSGVAARVQTVLTPEADNGFAAAFRLPGVVSGAGQQLTVDLTFADGTTQRVESNLTAQLSGFNSGVEPFRLTANLHLPVESGFGSSIEGWQIADGGSTDAH